MRIAAPLTGTPASRPGRRSRWLAGVARIDALALAAILAVAGSASAQQPSTPSSQTQPAAVPAQAASVSLFSQQQLETLLGPIALYSDSLLAQVLPATAYPLDIVEASRWVDENKAAVEKGDFSGLDSKNWDPSVKALARFPTVLAKLDKDLDWTRSLGDAFVAQPKDVTTAVQILRAKASKSGALKTNKQQTVVTKKATGGGSSSTIVIQDTDPGIVYVPEYNPTVVYDDSAAVVAGALAFTSGVVVGSAIAGSYWNWGGGWVYPPVWPGYPGYRPWNNANVWNNNTFIHNGDTNININGHNIVNPTTPWRPDPNRFQPSQRLQNAFQNRPGGAGNLAGVRPGQGGAGTLNPNLVRPGQGGAGLPAANAVRPGQGGAGTRNPNIVRPNQGVRPGQGGAGTRVQNAVRPGQGGAGTHRPAVSRPGQGGAGTRIQPSRPAANRSFTPRNNAFSGLDHGGAAMSFSGRGAASRFEGFQGGGMHGGFSGGGFRGGGFGGGFHGGGGGFRGGRFR